MKKENKVKVLVFAGALIAMNIVLSRLLVLNIGPTLRITVSQTPVYLAGFWFGPVVGGICGFLGDLIGSLLQGYAPNPFISLSAILTGVLPGIASYLIKKTNGNLACFRCTGAEWTDWFFRVYLHRTAPVL